jgi:hypothetical protein
LVNLGAAWRISHELEVLDFLGAIKGIANYALDKANKGYDKLNPVQQEIFDNPDKYPYASKIAPVENS